MPVSGGDSGTERLLICRVGTKLCGVPVEHVVETMRPLPVEHLANMPSFVSGLSLIRGRPTAVLDGRALLGSTPADSARARYVSLKLGERRVALWVDAVVGIRDVARADFEQLPRVLRESAGERVDALARLDAELLLVLEHTRLLSEAELASLASLDEAKS